MELGIIMSKEAKSKIGDKLGAKTVWARGLGIRFNLIAAGGGLKMDVE